MRLILAVSADDILAIGPDDDMGWTGSTDKAIFRLLTGVGRGVCAAGRRTWQQLPPLPGREVYCLSRQPRAVVRELPITAGPSEPVGEVSFEHSWTLDAFHRAFPDGWLLGGPEVAMEALEANLVDQVYLCRSSTKIWPHGYVGPDAIRDTVTPWLMSRGELQNQGTPWKRAQRIKFGEVTVDVWRCLCPTATARAASGAG